MQMGEGIVKRSLGWFYPLLVKQYGKHNTRGILAAEEIVLSQYVRVIATHPYSLTNTLSGHTGSSFSLSVLQAGTRL